MLASQNSRMCIKLTKSKIGKIAKCRVTHAFSSATASAKLGRKRKQWRKRSFFNEFALLSLPLLMKKMLRCPEYFPLLLYKIDVYCNSRKMCHLVVGFLILK